jgi:hypothetical protein
VLLVSQDEQGGMHVEWPLLDELGISYGRDLTPTNVDNFAFEFQGTVWPMTFLAGAGGGFDYLRTLDRYVATRVDLVDTPAASGLRAGAASGAARLRAAFERRDF